MKLTFYTRSLPILGILFTLTLQGFAQDLRIYGIRRPFSSQVLTAGNSFRVEAEEINNTNTNAGASYTGYYLSSNRSLDGSDIFMGKQYRRSNAANPNGGDFEWNPVIPSNTISGQYYLLVVADVDNDIAETNEGNNVASKGPFTVNGVNPPTVDPDYTIISNFRVDVEQGNSWVNDVNSADWGDYIRIAYTIRNLTAGTTNERLFVSAIWSRDANLQTVQDNVLLDEKEISTLGGNASLNDIIWNIFVPNVSNVGFGSGHILLIADLFDRIDETDENNNIASRSFAIYVPSGRTENMTAKHKDAGFKSDTDKLGTNLTPFSNEILVYPNPFSDRLNLTMSTEGKSQISVHDISGRLIWRRKYEGIISETIDMSGQPSGIYMLKFTNQLGTQVRKVVKE